MVDGVVGKVSKAVSPPLAEKKKFQCFPASKIAAALHSKFASTSSHHSNNGGPVAEET